MMFAMWIFNHFCITRLSGAHEVCIQKIWSVDLCRVWRVYPTTLGMKWNQFPLLESCFEFHRIPPKLANFLVVGDAVIIFMTRKNFPCLTGCWRGSWRGEGVSACSCWFDCRARRSNLFPSGNFQRRSSPLEVTVDSQPFIFFKGHVMRSHHPEKGSPARKN